MWEITVQHPVPPPLCRLILEVFSFLVMVGGPGIRGGGREGGGQGGCSPLISGSLISPFPWVAPDDGINGGRVLMGVCRGGPWYSISVGGITGTTGVVCVSASQPGPDLIY